MFIYETAYNTYEAIVTMNNIFQKYSTGISLPTNSQVTNFQR